MALRRAIGAVKDKTSIGLAKVGSTGSLADLEVSIVKTTRHEELPAEERHIREILSLTCYSQAFISECVNTISRRLNKTKNWVVALKTLMLVQRLLTEGDPAYEEEIFFTTRRGTRLLNMSDFRDTSRSNSWDFSAFVRIYAMYLDERLEYRMQGKRRKHNACAYSYEEKEKEKEDNVSVTSPSRSVAVDELNIDEILSKVLHLQRLLERFLATKPTGMARHHRLVTAALYPIVKESHNIYYDTTELLSVLIDRFKDLEIPDCVKVYETFCRISTQFDELDEYYSWCKEAGVIRTSECPEVEKITRKKLELMDEFIREKESVARRRLSVMDNEEEAVTASQEEEQETAEDMNQIKALPPPEDPPENEEKVEAEKEEKRQAPDTLEADLLHLGDDAPTSEDHRDRLALALFDGAVGPAQAGPPPPLIWEVVKDKSDWETTLVQSASYLPHQKAAFGGGFDALMLDGMYQQGAANAAMAANRVGGSGSGSSVALGSLGNPHLLALPAPPSSSGSGSGNVDPFAASLAVPPPPYVQMSDMEKKQRLLMEEQLVWQQYQKNGMEGHLGLPNLQGRPANMEGYGYGH
ncbi:hypothetical protein Cgig2_005162 [Carnegiea gigantea]|uniref:ENTH domain-containing protein n=1 Tax=Carnegiea gigantea TaxID=171969 RepID=A0A9Q1KFD6_9CARY|nr:hypothetical protein Cgig2_005162 [Carnegiea gigantea]